MADNDPWNYIATISSVVLAIVALINEEYRLIAIFSAIGFIVVVAVSRLNKDIEDQKSEIRRLTEKVNIYKDLSLMRSDIEYLKKRRR